MKCVVEGVSGRRVRMMVEVMMRKERKKKKRK